MNGKNQEEIVKDHVCGMEKPKSEMVAQTTHQGVTYYFCTEQDKHMFEAFPDRWVPQSQDPSPASPQQSTSIS